MRPRQLHNQPEQSHQHQFLVDLWQEVRRETGGALDVTVHASNANVAGSDPRVLEMLVAGEVEFATMMGPLIGNLVPAAEIQGVPFAFHNSQQAHAALDGALGDFLIKEMESRGIYAVPGGALENGFRQICSVSRAVRTPDDLAGYRMRVPAGRILAELFEALGAKPVTVNIDGLHAALREGRVDGHENPLAIVEVNRLHDVTKHVCMTSHVWSGFNLIANLAYWRSLSEHAQDAIHRAASTHVARQRSHAVALNLGLEESLRSRRVLIQHVEQAPFRARIAPVLYARWKERCGTTAWRLLRDAGGRLD
jgi:tripartite ATP-independent transporter DctP family solute receptor